jgi:1-acyl-sn-glycerol-3-phosphate acyltransferase
MSGTFTANLRAAAQMVFFTLVIRPFVTLFIGLRVLGKEHLPVRDPFVLIANHSSHLDTVSLLSLFPLTRLRHIRPCAAADTWERTPGVAFFSHTFFNTLPIARRNITPDTHPVRRMREALTRGESLILFPEGTRGTGGAMTPFKPGIAHLIEEVPGVPIVPAYLANMGRSLPKGEWLPVPFICEVHLGPPRIVEGTREEILRTLERAVLELKESGRRPSAVTSRGS